MLARETIKFLVKKIENVLTKSLKKENLKKFSTMYCIIHSFAYIFAI